MPKKSSGGGRVPKTKNPLFGLRLKIEETNPPDIKKRLMNTIMREGLYKTGEMWIEEYLPDHFDKSAVQKYGYRLVSKVYAIIKNRAKRVRPWIGRMRGSWVPAPKPVRPWVWSGMTMRDLLFKPTSAFNIKARSTTNKQTVSVPVKVPHPVTTEHAGELVRYTPDEFRAMHKFCFGYIIAELEKIKSIRSQEFTW